MPLRADGCRQRFGSGFVAAGSANTGAQRLQHFAIGFVLDAFRQGGCLDGSATQDAFNGRGIRFTAQRGADLLRDCGAGFRVLQRVLLLPLRADGCRQRFGSGFVALSCGNATAQGLQHGAVGFGAHADRQCGGHRGLFCDFFGDAAEDGFHGCGIGFARASQGGDDPLRDGGARGLILQVVVGMQLAADARGKRFLRDGVLRFAEAVTQGFEQVVVVGFVEACRGLSRFFGGAVQYGFDQRGVVVAVTAQDGGHLFGDGGADGAVLQAVLVLPLVADGSGKRFLHFGAVGVVQVGAQGFHHHAVGILAHTFGQHARHALRHVRQHGIQHAFIDRAFAGKRRFQVGDDVVAGFAFGGDALLQPLAADAVGKHRLHVFIGTGGKAATQGTEHAVVGLFADAMRGFVGRQIGGDGRGEAGLYRHGGVPGGIRLGEDVGDPLRLRAIALEAGEQALRHCFAQRRIIGDALLPLAADSFGQRRLHVGIRLAHAQTALQGAQRLVVTFLPGKIAGSGSRSGNARRFFLALVRDGICAGRRHGFGCDRFWCMVTEGEIVCGQGNGGRFVWCRTFVSCGADAGGSFGCGGLCRFVGEANRRGFGFCGSRAIVAGKGNRGRFRFGGACLVGKGDVIKGCPFVINSSGRRFRDRNCRACRKRCAIGEAQLARQGIERLLFALRRVHQRQTHPFGNQRLL